MRIKHKIFISCGSLTSGGAERVLSILSTPFAENYSEVTYITWDDLPVFYTIDNRVKLVCVEKECGTKNILKRILWFRRYIKKNKPDLVLSFSAPYNMLSLASLLWNKTKIVVAERVDPRSFRWGKHMEIARNLLYRTATGILAQTEQSRSYFKGALLKKTNIIYNPVTMSEEMVGKALRTPKDSLIVSAARLEKQKQQTLIIDAFARFSKNHPEYKLIIFGEGNERNNLLSRAKEVGIDDRFELPGSVKNLWERIVHANMFIMTSLFEGMSNSLIEAMCLGLPCISTKVSGATDLIQNNENGFLIDINDIDSLYKCMEKLHDSNTSQRIGSNATSVYRILKTETIANEWINYIDKIIK